MKRNRDTIMRQPKSKKKKAFSISSIELADAVADYVAKGGEINMIENPFKNKEDKQIVEPKQREI